MAEFSALRCVGHRRCLEHGRAVTTKLCVGVWDGTFATSAARHLLIGIPQRLYRFTASLIGFMVVVMGRDGAGRGGAVIIIAALTLP